jgi:hypothetical protein
MLRPKLKLPAGLEEACAEVNDLEDKLRRTYFIDTNMGDNANRLHDIPGTLL